MARQFITKATIKRLFQARQDSHNYTSKKSQSTWLLQFIGTACGLDESECLDFLFQEKWAMDKVYCSKIYNQYAGTVIPGWLLRDGKPFGNFDEVQISMTHGLNTITCHDINALAKSVFDKPNY